MPRAFARLEAIVRTSMALHGGYVHKMIGDGLQVGFHATAATAAAALTGNNFPGRARLMHTNLPRSLVSTITRIGVSPDDSEECRLQKTLLVLSSFMMASMAYGWGSLYLVFGQRLAASIPLSYATLSYLSIAWFSKSRRYLFFRFSQLLLSLLLPFFLMIALGGFHNGSAVVLWSLSCPLGALVFAGRRQALGWFLFYLALVIISAFLEPFLPPANALPQSMVIVFFVMNISGVSVVAFVLLQYFLGQRDLNLKLLRIEREKSENLLLNILPKEIAERLKNETRTIADSFEETTILFADLVNFTPLATDLSPTQMVELLNEIFSQFDSLVEKHDVEKIETVGDEYMVAAGVPRPRADHAQAIARLALDICAFLNARPDRYGHHLDFRIGIHSGRVTAGVIGRKKFAYELFGDTVNTANRMQSHGVPGRIQISSVTYELLKDEFICEARGRVMVKGKGEMETWFLVGNRPNGGVI